MRDADIVLSTAQHEFQGLAVLQAVASGCLPAVPDRQAYPEIFAGEFRYPCHGGDAQAEARDAAALVCRLFRALEQGDVAAPDVSHFGSAYLQRRYSDLSYALAEPAG